jgi:hypothetical protein
MVWCSPIFTEVLLDNFVVRKRDALPINLTITSLYKRVSEIKKVYKALTVDEFTDRLLVGVAVCD